MTDLLGMQMFDLIGKAAFILVPLSGLIILKAKNKYIKILGWTILSFYLILLIRFSLNIIALISKPIQL